MNPQLAKEFRPLRLPCIVACIAAMAMALLTPFEGCLHGARVFSPIILISLLLQVSPFFFFACIVILAALSFGAEFQERTLPLLLTQPLPRSRTWNYKILTVAIAICTPLLIYVLFHISAQRLSVNWFPLMTRETAFPPGQTTMVGAFLVTTFASCAFWTLVARSTIGGLVFTMASHFGIALGLFCVVEWIGHRNGGTGYGEEIYGSILLIVSIAAAPLFLWLGRRRFASLEVREPIADASPRSPRWLVGAGQWLGWLRCRPSQSVLNLVRKELYLSKPIVMIAVVFTLCWLLTTAMWFLVPSRHEVFETIFNVLTAFYVPLICLLAGCISLGEEKAFGVAQWNLTLPVRVRRLWLIKLAVGAAFAVLLGWLLPGILAVLLSPVVKVGLIINVVDKAGALMIFGPLSLNLFLISFWAINVLGTTVRAALNSLIALAVLGVCAVAGTWLGNAWELQTNLLMLIAVRFHPPVVFLQPGTWSTWPVLFLAAPPAILILVQSLAFFGRAQISRRTLVTSAVGLCLATALPAFWFSDFVASSQRVNHYCLMGAEAALESTKSLAQDLKPGQERVVTLAEIERSGNVSDLTRVWLTGATITISRPLNPSRGKATYNTLILLSNGRRGKLTYYLPNTPAAE